MSEVLKELLLELLLIFLQECPKIILAVDEVDTWRVCLRPWGRPQKVLLLVKIYLRFRNALTCTSLMCLYIIVVVMADGSGLALRLNHTVEEGILIAWFSLEQNSFLQLEAAGWRKQWPSLLILLQVLRSQLMDQLHSRRVIDGFHSFALFMGISGDLVGVELVLFEKQGKPRQLFLPPRR